ncbi:class I SAM-dependent methyltransferase [Streptomyces erythrochromogenes]|uniref:class I SAM-dependent methyltransferase n=1 Tax=Streptomyces erythrochromogenes TaxID=285574 RepID=UPI0033DDBC59
MHVEVPPWLRRDPNVDVDHDYLTEAEIDALPDGVFYKRKASLTRHRFVKATIVVDGFPVLIEMVDNRGSWRLPASASSKLRERMPAELGEREMLALVGLADTVSPEGAPLPPSRVRHPQTYSDIISLYRDYCDMERQGHFTDDSPDVDRLRAVVAATPAGSRVVDLGCNSGAFGAQLMEKKGCVVAGVDLAHHLLLEARSKGVSAIRAFAERTPFKSGVFDVVLCCELLEHVLEPDLLLEEARRLTRPGGLLVITVPHADGEWGERDVPYHPEHLRAYREGDLDALVHAHGFQVTQMLVHHYGHTAPQELIVSAARYR